MHMHSTQARDAALRRLRSANRWLLAASIAATGALTEVAAQAFPGRTIRASAATRARRPGAGRAGSAAGSAPTPLRAPAQAPESPKSSAPVESSGAAESSSSAETPAPAGEASGEAGSAAQGSSESERSGQAPEAVVSGAS